MFSKIRTITLAVAAVAAVGAATFVSTSSADARGFGGGGFGHGGFGGGHVAGHVSSLRGAGNFQKIRVNTPRIIGHRPGNKLPPAIRIGRHLPHLHWCRYSWNRCGIHVRWHRPWIYGVGVATAGYAVAPTVAASPAPSCTCLTKQYTPDNLVVFQDVCTKEVASAPIGNTQVQIQAPVQQQ